MRTSLQQIDADAYGNGEVSLEELIVIDQSNQTMESVIKLLGFIFISILIANFVVSLAAAIWAQATDVSGTALVANGAMAMTAVKSCRQRPPRRPLPSHCLPFSPSPN